MPGIPTTPGSYETLIAKAWKDPAFREALRKDPRGTIERELNVKLPEGLDVQLVEETPTKVYLVLPAAPQPAEGRELSDEDLGSVAGGVVTPLQPAGFGKARGSWLPAGSGGLRHR